MTRPAFTGILYYDQLVDVHLLTGNGVDYNSTSIIATFAAGATSTTVNIPVTNDDIAEESETFDLSFAIPPSLNGQVKPGNITAAIGNITDDTSKMICY